LQTNFYNKMIIFNAPEIKMPLSFSSEEGIDALFLFQFKNLDLTLSWYDGEMCLDTGKDTELWVRPMFIIK
jgi:hypothetical protein